MEDIDATIVNIKAGRRPALDTHREPTESTRQVTTTSFSDQNIGCVISHHWDRSAIVYHGIYHRGVVEPRLRSYW